MYINVRNNTSIYDQIITLPDICSTVLKDTVYKFLLQPKYDLQNCSVTQCYITHDANF